jgi:hypothetical protein
MIAQLKAFRLAIFAFCFSAILLHVIGFDGTATILLTIIALQANSAALNSRALLEITLMQSK